MSKLSKYNEFIDNDVILIKKLIEESENTNLPDLVSISNREVYQKVISYGKKVIPYLLERNSIIWDIALSRITGDGLNPLKYNTSDRLKYWQKLSKIKNPSQWEGFSFS